MKAASRYITRAEINKFDMLDCVARWVSICWVCWRRDGAYLQKGKDYPISTNGCFNSPAEIIEIITTGQGEWWKTQMLMVTPIEWDFSTIVVVEEV